MALLNNTLMDTLDKELIGARFLFDRLNGFYEDKSHSSTFPHYNIIETDPSGKYKIQIALAGYKKENIEIKQEDSELRITGHRETESVNYIYCGISARSVERKFMLQEDVKVIGASFEDGILNIMLERIVLEKAKAKLIQIN